LVDAHTVDTCISHTGVFDIPIAKSAAPTCLAGTLITVGLIGADAMKAGAICAVIIDILVAKSASPTRFAGAGIEGGTIDTTAVDTGVSDTIIP
jgi:hypothetical protein